MSAPMKKSHIKSNKGRIIRIYHAGAVYQLPKKLVEKYRVREEWLDPDEVFSGINEKHTKPGALLRGLRIREGLTQIEMAKKINATQSNISQMESGARKIGRKIAQRVETVFGINYRLFLE